ncbi:transcriptional regulator, partial [Enterococcus faecalis]|nr:transcriptional regulator [Enterococcus faecalis]EGO9500931.1 transcriptional regulator [Enterococcus faecalis]
PFLKKILNDKSIDRFYEFIYHLIIRWDELQASLNKLPPKMKTGIYFFTDIEHNLFMKKFFTERFRDILAIDNLFTLDSSVDLKEVVASYDLLLTNIPIPDVVERNIICCSLFPTNAQLEEIASYYSKWLTTTT